MARSRADCKTGLAFRASAGTRLAAGLSAGHTKRNRGDRHERRAHHRDHGRLGHVEDAIRKGIDRAAKTLKNVEGARVREQKAALDNGRITACRINLKLAFVLDD